MDFAEWEPYYELILREFGYSRDEDESSASLLASKVTKEQIVEISELRHFFEDEVIVLGNGPSLRWALDRVELKGTIITAGPATSILMSNGIVPTMFVTDLDGPVVHEISANGCGAIGVIHAHGDNMPSILENIDKFHGRLVLTTQSRPFGSVKNLGGFTDGDRAVIMARSLGAKKIMLVGFDFDRPTPKEGSDIEVKRRKLQWAKKLIFELNPPDVEIFVV